MTLSIPQERVLAITEQCHLFLTEGPVLVKETFQLIGKLCYSAMQFFQLPFTTDPFKDNRSSNFQHTRT